METKIAILLLYLRIFPDSCSNVFRRCCLILIFICMACMIAICLTQAFECHPVSLAWMMWDGLHHGHCIDTVAQVYAAAIINMLLDFTVFLIPIPKVMKLEISTGKKIAATAIFCVGIFAVGCSCARAVYLPRWGLSTNPLWQYNDVAFWSVIECNVGVICACAPAMTGPIKRFWKVAVKDRISLSVSNKDRASRSIQRIPSPATGQAGQGVQRRINAVGPGPLVSPTLTIPPSYAHAVGLRDVELAEIHHDSHQRPDTRESDCHSTHRGPFAEVDLEGMDDASSGSQRPLNKQERDERRLSDRRSSDAVNGGQFFHAS
jgi:hypothetical protein